MTDALTVSASAVVAAPAAEVFAFICTPANHAEISGDDSVKGVTHGPDQLTALGDKFGEKMKMYGIPYRISNKVVEFEADALVAWCHPGKHRWRWTVEAIDATSCRVTETFDMSTSSLKPALKLLGYPASHQDNVEASVANVAAHFA